MHNNMLLYNYYLLEQYRKNLNRLSFFKKGCTKVVNDIVATLLIRIKRSVKREVRKSNKNSFIHNLTTDTCSIILINLNLLIA